MTTPVKFEISKLLKEKGFNLKVISFYDYERLSTPFDKQRQVDGLINYNPINWNSVKNHYTSAPTIGEVVMWLYEKYGIWIGVDKDDISEFYSTVDGYEICSGKLNPTEAYEVAIEYSLMKII